MNEALRLLQEVLDHVPTNWLGNCDVCYADLLDDERHKPTCIYAKISSFLEVNSTNQRRRFGSE